MCGAGQEAQSDRLRPLRATAKELVRHWCQSWSESLSSVPMPNAMKRAMNKAPGTRAISQKASQPGIQAAFCAGLYEAMKSRTLASVSGQSLRGRLLGLPRNSVIKRQSPSASRPNVLSAIS